MISVLAGRPDQGSLDQTVLGGGFSSFQSGGMNIDIRVADLRCPVALACTPPLYRSGTVPPEIDLKYSTLR